MSEDVFLVCGRVCDAKLTHPQAIYNRVCCRCGEPVILYPTSQQALADPNFNDVKIVCMQCVNVEDILKSRKFYYPRNLAQERRESIDFTKRKQ